MSCCSTCSTGRCALRFRLHGTELVRHAGYDMTGKMMDDLPNQANRDTLLARCRSLIETREPVAVIRERLLGKRVFGCEAVWLLPGDDGSTISILMGGVVHRQSRAAQSPGWMPAMMA
jgi:hypothetical protein